MITKEDEKNIAAKAALIMDQPVTNRALLLAAAYVCHAIVNTRIETQRNDTFPDEVIGIFDELFEQLTKEYTIDHEKAIDPEFERE